MNNCNCRIPLEINEESAIALKLSDDDSLEMAVGEKIVMGDDYERLTNKPTINTVEVVGHKVGDDYHLQNKLIAGDNITLDGTVISADVDLEYASYLEVFSFLNS